MRRLAQHLLWVGCLLTGCVSPVPYGEFVIGSLPPHMQERLALETVTRMEDLYPPATTRLALMHPATDAYGVALTEALRRKGYALTEYHREANELGVPQQGRGALVQSPRESREDGLALRYVIDGPIEERLYRVTVFIGHQSLSRVYHMDAQTMAQAGAWVRKE